MSRVASVLLIILAAGLTVVTWLIIEQKREPADLSRVAIRGELDARQQERVAAVLRERDASDLDIESVREVIAGLDWVYEARVMRRWPDGLVIEIVKEVPIAWWNDDAFINAEGKVFVSPYVDLSNLPQLYGPNGAEGDVMQQFQILAKALSRVEQTIDTLKLDDRGSWQFETNEGIRVMLGKEDIMDRVQRFLFVFERVGLADRVDGIEQIDARYPNGLAVSWAEVPQGVAVAEAD